MTVVRPIPRTHTYRVIRVSRVGLGKRMQEALGVQEMKRLKPILRPAGALIPLRRRRVAASLLSIPSDVSAPLRASRLYTLKVG